MDGATEVLHSKGGELETGEVRGAEEEEEDRDNNKVEPSKGNRNHHLRIVFIIFSHTAAKPLSNLTWLNLETNKTRDNISQLLERTDASVLATYLKSY